MVNIDQVVIENLSPQDLDKLAERVAAAKKIPAGKKAVALAAALKEIFAEIKRHDPEILGPAFESFNTQALPKEANIGRRYGLSETQVKMEKDKAEKLVGSL